MSKSIIHKLSVFSVSRKFSFFYGAGFWITGFDNQTGLLKSLYVPLHKVIVNEDFVYPECFVTTNKFGFISYVSLPVELVRDVFQKKNFKNILGGIL